MAAISQDNRNALIGGLTLTLGVALLCFAYLRGHGAESVGYDVSARFNHAEGIGAGSVVQLAGMAIGRVKTVELDNHFNAVLTIRLQPGVGIPKDSAAMIYSDGLMGGKFITIQPGGDEENMKQGDQFVYTQDSINLNKLLELIIAQGRSKRGLPPEPGVSVTP